MNAITSSDRAFTNDERLAAWAIKYYGHGLHRTTPQELRDMAREPSGRVTVPPPLTHHAGRAPAKELA